MPFLVSRETRADRRRGEGWKQSWRSSACIPVHKQAGGREAGTATGAIGGTAPGYTQACRGTPAHPGVSLVARYARVIFESYVLLTFGKDVLRGTPLKPTPASRFT